MLYCLENNWTAWSRFGEASVSFCASATDFCGTVVSFLGHNLFCGESFSIRASVAAPAQKVREARCSRRFLGETVRGNKQGNIVARLAMRRL